MTPPGVNARQRVAIVTGGGGGIGAAVAEAIAATGTLVVTVDPLVSLDGSEQLPPPAETTAGRIEAAGGSARASSLSVTDRDGVHQLVADLVAEFGGVDAVVNVAGITRPTTFSSGTEEDWRSVLEVHLDGYRNVLDAAIPVMAAAGHGRVLGVTSGSGWRPADAGAYSCAKRAVASLTWQLGRCAPPGVVVNAMSPIAMTRMVEAAMRRAGGGAARRSSGHRSGSSRTGGLSLGSMPMPDELGPLGAHLVGAEFAACTGQVVFAGGSEVAVVEEPHLLEVVHTRGIDGLGHVLGTVLSGAFVPAEAAQASQGGSNARFGSLLDAGAEADSDTGRAAPLVERCIVVTDRNDVGDAVAAAVERRGIACHTVPADAVGFSAAAAALASAEQQVGPVDAVVVARSGMPAGHELAGGWARVLAEHDGLVDRIHGDAAWTRAVADLAAASGRPIRLVSLVDASTAGGRSRAQAAIQLSRAARGATGGRVVAFAVGLETAEPDPATVGELTAHLLGDPDADGLSGAELATGTGWVGLRSHPRPRTSLVLAEPTVPPWLDTTLAEVTGGRLPEQW